MTVDHQSRHRSLQRLLAPCLLVGLLTGVTSGRAVAQDGGGSSNRPLISFTLENDVDFLSRKGDDRFYTNGFRLAALWPSCYLPRPFDDRDGLFLPFVGRKPGESAEERVCPPIPHGEPASDTVYPYRFNFGLVLGQNLYTPEDLRLSQLQINDRPYGAWLYLGAILTLTGDRVAHTLELDVGTVGPSAFGEEVQDFVHEYITDSREAQGWNNQIGNEPGLLLSYDLRWRLLELIPHRKADKAQVRVFDVIPTVGGALGNIFTFAKVGTMGRVGWNIPADFGPPGRIIALAPESLGPQPPAWSFYLFGGAEGRAVGRNIFLDGNTFRESHSVPKEDFVADLEWGFTARFRAFSLTYRHVRRSREWVGQSDPQVFGAAILSYDLGF